MISQLFPGKNNKIKSSRHKKKDKSRKSNSTSILLAEESHPSMHKTLKQTASIIMRKTLILLIYVLYI